MKNKIKTLLKFIVALPLAIIYVIGYFGLFFFGLLRGIVRV